MSTNQTLALLEGDHTNSLAAIFSCFRYRMIEEATEIVPGGQVVWEKLRFPRAGESRLISHKAVLTDGHWTAILDLSFTFFADESGCEKCAQEFSTRIVGYLASGISGTYAIYAFAPSKVRELVIQESSIEVDFGKPLPEEDGINKEALSDTSLFDFVAKLGFNESLFENPSSSVMIVALDESLIDADNASRPPAALAPPKRP